MKMDGIGAYGPFSYANPGQSLQTLNGMGVAMDDSAQTLPAVLSDLYGPPATTTQTAPATGVVVASSPSYNFLLKSVPSLAAKIPATMVNSLFSVGGVSITPLDLLAFYFLYRLLK